MSTPTPHLPTPHPPRFLSPRFNVETPTPEAETLSSLPIPWPYLTLAVQMAQDYQMLLPDHPEWRDETVAWADDQSLCLATVRFLERVNEHCFPVWTDMMVEDIEECAYFLAYAPLLPSGLDLWDDWSSYNEPIPLLCYVHMQAWARRHAPQEVDRTAYAELHLPDDMELVGLDETMTRLVFEGRLTLPAPLEALPHLIRMVTKTSDNFWLDCNEEELGYSEWVGWDDIDVPELTLAWENAAPIVAKVNALVQWVGKEPRPRLATIADILKQAHLYRQNMPREGTF